MWGATSSYFPLSILSPFQSTHPCGVRLLLMIINSKRWVSIHAPVWGATVVSSIQSAASSFNPRTRVGCDLTFRAHHTTAGKFQSTHPCGVRLPVKGSHCLPLQFQSTHPCGVRHIVDVVLSTKKGFNPRTRVGCDTWPSHLTTRDGFQSTHPCGVRLYQSPRTTKKNGFNPRTRVGCDGVNCFIKVSDLFQSTHPCGVRRLWDEVIADIHQFQSTHPCGVRRCGLPLILG